MKRIIISLLLSPLTMMAMEQHINHVMRTTSDDARNVDVRLDWQITTEDCCNLLSIDDPRLLVSYYAIFKKCNNRTVNLNPYREGYTKNLSSNGYTLTAMINSVEFEKHIGDSISLTYITTKDDKSDENRDSLDLKYAMRTKNPIDQNLHMRLRLSEFKDDTQKK